MATSQQPTPQGQQYVVDFTQSINLDNVGEKVYPFDDGVAPHLANTGILRDDGVTNLYETSSTSSYTKTMFTPSGHKVEVGGNRVYIDDTLRGTYTNAIVSRTKLDCVDFALSSTGTGIRLRLLSQTRVFSQYYLEEFNLTTGVVINSTALTPRNNGVAVLVKSNAMTFANTQVAMYFSAGAGNLTCLLISSANSTLGTIYTGAGNGATFRGIAAVSNGGRVVVSGIPDNTVAPRTYYNNVAGVYGAWTAITDCAYICSFDSFHTTVGKDLVLIGTPSNISTANIGNWSYNITLTTIGGITVTANTAAGLVIIPTNLYSGFGYASGLYKSAADVTFTPFSIIYNTVTALPGATDCALKPQPEYSLGALVNGQAKIQVLGSALNGILSQVGNSLSPACEYGYISPRTAVCIFGVREASTADMESYIFIPGDASCQLVKVTSDPTQFNMTPISKDVFTLGDDTGFIYDAASSYSEQNYALEPQTFFSAGFVTGTNSVAWQAQGLYSNAPDVGQFNGVAGLTVSSGVITGALSMNSNMTMFSGVGTLFSVLKVTYLDEIGTESYAYVPNPNVPAPVDAVYNGGGVTLKSGAALQTVNFSTAVGFAQYYAGYTLANQYPVSYQFFNLFGQLYGFDGTKIYRMPVNGATAGTPEQVAFASGLTFITNAPMVAWFWSSFDNSIYSFDGGQNVQKWQEMPGVATVVSGAYSVLESSLYLQLSDDTTLVFRDDKASQLANAYTSQTIYATDSGTYFVNADNGSQSKKWSYFAGTGTPIALTWQSGFYGWGRNQWGRITQVVFTLKVADSATTDITVNFKGLSSTDNWTETMTFTGGSYTASSTGYVRLQYNPTNPLVYGASVGISCTKKVTLYECVVYYTDGGVAQVPNLGP